MKENIIVFCAHADDESIGLGGTIAKFANEGKNIVIVIFSIGEKSQPHLKESYVRKVRINEITRITKSLGSKRLVFLNMEDSTILKNVDNDKILKKVEDIIKKYKPEKIFTHSESDPHLGGDHIGVNKIVTKVVDKINYRGDVYSYEVWNIVKENRPVMYVDITPYFKKKIQAMKMFKSQWHFVYTLLIPVYWRALNYGDKIKVKYAEKFYKIR